MPPLDFLGYRQIHGTFYAYPAQQAKRNRATILSYLPQETLYQTMLGSYSDAKLALQTPSIYKKLTLSQRMLAIEAHESLAQAMLDDMECFGNLNGKLLARLCKDHVTLAHKILSTPKYYDLLNGACFAILGETHLEIAECIYQEPNTAKQLYAKHWAILAQNHYSLAKKILNDEKIASQLSAADLIIMSRKNIKIAYYIYKKNRTFNKLDSNIGYAALFCSNHFDLTDGFFHEHKSMLSGIFLAALGQNFPEISDLILSDPSLCAELTCIDLSYLGQETEAIGLKILKEKALLERHSILIGPYLASLGKNFINNAWYILNNKKLCDQLLGEGLASLGENLPEIANYILKTEYLATQLCGENLVQICQDQPETALYILETESLAKKLNERQKLDVNRVIIAGNIVSRSFLPDTEKKNILENVSRKHDL